MSGIPFHFSACLCSLKVQVMLNCDVFSYLDNLSTTLHVGLLHLPSVLRVNLFLFAVVS